MKIILIGQKFQQSRKLEFILDNLQNCEINYIDLEINVFDQIQKIKKNCISNSPLNLIYEIRKSNNQQQERVISQLKKAQIQSISLILLISDDQDEEEAKKVRNQINYKCQDIQIANLVDYFKKNYGYDNEMDLNGKQIVMLLSKEQDVKNTIFQTIQSPAILQNKWALVNTPSFNLNSENEQKEEVINEFKQIFNRYQDQISLFIIIVYQDRNDTMKKNFNDIYLSLRKFKKKIIVLLYNRYDEDFEENSTIKRYFFNLAKIRNCYLLSNNQLQGQQQIDDYFNKILEEQKDDEELGIDTKDTIFEITDEKQLELEKDRFEKEFSQNKIELLEESVDQNKQQIQQYYQKIGELEKINNEYQNQITELKRFQKQKNVQETQKEIQVDSKKLKESKIPQHQCSCIPNQNQAIDNIEDSEPLKMKIQILDNENKEIQQQIQECYNKIDNINQTKNKNKNRQVSNGLEEQLTSQIEDYWKRYQDNENKIAEYNKQIQSPRQNIKKDNNKYTQANNGSNYRNTSILY